MRSARTSVTTVAAASLAVLAAVATAGPAAANSFSKDVYQGRVWYDDGQDRFCVKADETGINDRAVITVTLTPYDSSRGPSRTLGDIDTPGKDCVSLATAYEDTYYKAVIKSLTHFDRGGDSTYQRTVKSFYS